MIELIFVIVILGILAALAIPRMDRDIKQEAADSILSDIRYTQHLALLSSKHKFNKEKWQQRFWRIVFSNCSNDIFYMIGTDDDMGSSSSANFAKEEAAIDPYTGKPMFYACSGVNKEEVSNKIFINKKYGITNINAAGGCSGTVNGSGGKHIGFDHLGRPHYGFSRSTLPDNTSYMSEPCIFTFTMSDSDTFAISIQPETGYAQIIDQNAS